MTQPFKSVQFSRGHANVDKLNQMAANDEWLKEHMSTLMIDHQGLKKDTQMKILAGSSVVAPTMQWSATAEVYFGNYFSSGCRPIVVHGLYGHPQTGVVSTIHGIGGGIPDHRGFGIYIVPYDRSGLRSYIGHPITIAYIAIGW